MCTREALYSEIPERIPRITWAFRKRKKALCIHIKLCVLEILEIAESCKVVALCAVMSSIYKGTKLGVCFVMKHGTRLILQIDFLKRCYGEYFSVYCEP